MNSDNNERTFVKMSDRAGPIIHESLPPELLIEIRDIYQSALIQKQIRPLQLPCSAVLPLFPTGG